MAELKTSWKFNNEMLADLRHIINLDYIISTWYTL